jgi:hypothetical protein
MRRLLIPPLLALSGIASAECPEFGTPRQLGAIVSGTLDELSGLAASRLNPGIYWTHNDKTGQNTVYALNERGEWRGSLFLDGAPALDWEDIAVGPGSDADRHYVYIGDFGSNNLDRAELRLHRFPEPPIAPTGQGTVLLISNVETMRFSYQGRALHDAETLLVDPITGDVLIVTRDRSGTNSSQVYRLGGDLPWNNSLQVAEFLFSITTSGRMDIKGGDVSPDGNHVLLVHHSNQSQATEVRLYQRDSSAMFSFDPGHCRVIPHPATPQTEAVCWTASGDGFLTTSEGSLQPLYFFPRLAPPPPLFINEFMASNSRTIADNLGQFDDWIEIYNAGHDPVNMGGMHLSDRLDNPTMWRVPDGTILPGKSFLLVWADSSPQQTAPGFLHANFSLAVGGEAIGLFDRNENNNRLIDGFSFGPQETDVSWGLLPDGQGVPRRLDTPTPGGPNAPVPADFPEGWLLH